jgi:rubredoxin-NAD+ reductase
LKNQAVDRNHPVRVFFDAQQVRRNGNDMNPIVILGTGLAAYNLAREFRKLDTTTPLRLISADDGSFYSKPVLSNALAQKKLPGQLALNSAEDMARQLHAAITPHTTVTAIDAAAHHVVADGETIPYDRLVLALGAEPIRVPLAGDAADAVLSVNNLADYTRFRAALDGKHRVTILGAGLIGCEFANDLRSAGVAVHVVDPAPQPLGRLLPPAAAHFFRTALEGVGVHFHFETTAQSLMHAGSSLRLAMADGSTLDTDVVLSAIGLKPCTALAQAAGMEIKRGVVTDAILRTTAPDVYALGDCAEVLDHNLPFVMPIMQAARALAKTLSGTATGVQYPAMPVVVKTPACPTVVCPPPPGVGGKWQEEVSAEGVRALFHDDHGQLRGYALVGAATKDKQGLTKEIPPLLG